MTSQVLSNANCRRSCFHVWNLTTITSNLSNSDTEADKKRPEIPYRRKVHSRKRAKKQEEDEHTKRQKSKVAYQHHKKKLNELIAFARLGEPCLQNQRIWEQTVHIHNRSVNCLQKVET